MREIKSSYRNLKNILNHDLLKWKYESKDPIRWEFKLLQHTAVSLIVQTKSYIFETNNELLYNNIQVKFIITILYITNKPITFSGLKFYIATWQLWLYIFLSIKASIIL